MIFNVAVGFKVLVVYDKVTKNQESVVYIKDKT